MLRPILLALTVAAGMATLSAPAHACPAGYKRVTIQGHSICQLDASASSALKSNGHGSGGTADPSTAAPKKKVLPR